MGVLELVNYLDVVKLNVEVLVDALERAADADVVLELDRHLVVDEGLEEAARCYCVSQEVRVSFPSTNKKKPVRLVEER
jgi:hypothetical protein